MCSARRPVDAGYTPDQRAERRRRPRRLVRHAAAEQRAHAARGALATGLLAGHAEVRPAEGREAGPRPRRGARRDAPAQGGPRRAAAPTAGNLRGGRDAAPGPASAGVADGVVVQRLRGRSARRRSAAARGVPAGALPSAGWPAAAERAPGPRDVRAGRRRRRGHGAARGGARQVPVGARGTRWHAGRCRDAARSGCVLGSALLWRCDGGATAAITTAPRPTATTPAAAGTAAAAAGTGTEDGACGVC
eukprot:356038-Chlamydomonas_euryale.AAC.5